MARETYDGVELCPGSPGTRCNAACPHKLGEVLDSDREHHLHWMGRVYALRHPDPARWVVAWDHQFDGTLRDSVVVPAVNDAVDGGPAPWRWLDFAHDLRDDPDLTMVQITNALQQQAALVDERGEWVPHDDPVRFAEGVAVLMAGRAEPVGALHVGMLLEQQSMLAITGPRDPGLQREVGCPSGNPTSPETRIAPSGSHGTSAAEHHRVLRGSAESRSKRDPKTEKAAAEGGDGRGV